MIDKATVGLKLKLCRMGAGLSETQLAEICGMARQIVVRTEAGTQYPTLPSLIKWVAACKTTLHEFFAELEEKSAVVDIVPAFENYYRLLSQIFRSRQQRYILGIQANLEAMAQVATERNNDASQVEEKAEPPPKAQIQLRKKRRG